MARWSIRDLWGRLTQKKHLNAQMRDMLLDLDGVYDPKASGESVVPADGERHEAPSTADAPR